MDVKHGNHAALASLRRERCYTLRFSHSPSIKRIRSDRAGVEQKVSEEVCAESRKMSNCPTNQAMKQTAQYDSSLSHFERGDIWRSLYRLASFCYQLWSHTTEPYDESGSSFHYGYLDSAVHCISDEFHSNCYCCDGSRKKARIYQT